MADMKSGAGKRLRWAAWICLLVPAVVGVYLSLFIDLGWRFGPLQTLLASVPFLFIAITAWIWPVSSGMAAVLWTAFWLWIAISRLDLGKAFLPIYGVIIIGGVLHIIIGLWGTKTASDLPYHRSPSDKRLHLVARICLFAAPVINIILGGVLDGINGSLLAAITGVPLLLLAAIAWVWPTLGGILTMLCGTFYSWYFILLSAYDYDYRWLVPMFGVFIIGGILHLITAWRQGNKADSLPHSTTD